MGDGGDAIPIPGRDPRGPSGLGPVEQVDSPERVRLDLELAGPMSRAFAYSIDYTLLLLIMLVVLLVSVSGLQHFVAWVTETPIAQDLVEWFSDWLVEGEIDDDGALLRAVALVLGIWMILELSLTSVYFVFFETLFAGRTPGKRVTHLRVVTEEGGVLDWKASLLRNLLRAVDTLPAGYLIGVVAMVLSPRVQRLGDVVAGTLVVRERATGSGEIVPPPRVDPDVEAGFRFTREELQAVGEVERRLMRRTLRRLEALPDRAAEPVVERATRALCARIGRAEGIPGALQRDFLAALLQASDRLV